MDPSDDFLRRPARRAVNMSDDEFDDFLNEMFWFIMDGGARLDWVPEVVTDRLPTGDVVHGPWDACDCSVVFVRWHNAGLIELRESDEASLAPGAPLPKDASAELLSRPDDWDATASAGHVVLIASTPLGEQRSNAQWAELVERSAFERSGQS